MKSSVLAEEWKEEIIEKIDSKESVASKTQQSNKFGVVRLISRGYP